jgi:hypothetical protein
MRIILICLVVALTACTEEQSKAISQRPKKTIDKVTTDVNKAMQQGSDRMKEEQK